MEKELFSLMGSIANCYIDKLIEDNPELDNFYKQILEFSVDEFEEI